MNIPLHYHDLSIEVFDDHLFADKGDQALQYDHVYQPDQHKKFMPVSQQAVVVYRNDVKIASTILLAAAGATSATRDSIVIDEGNLVTRCCNIVFSLALPWLTLNWMTEADCATCFSIHPFQDGYITHGELSIARIDRNGNVCWSFSGADIFVRLEGENPFQLYDDHIALTDFNGRQYKIDYNGETIQ
ncbi:hypothetical protein [Paraflavitalea pollutisoli]|uniref:hypothetical protein n=1 Tax=Paraflavitalea pollutisoli TaxID=3034143 RepID=UPI0023ED982C|nr:hypothetical protein [Paraflavitalea sp. H1-2-19X]